MALFVTARAAVAPSGRAGRVPIAGRVGTSPHDGQAARSAVMALHQALRVLRQYPTNAPLIHTALRRCTEALQLATAAAPLRLELADGGIRVAGETMLGYADAEMPFAALRHAGIAELELATGLPRHDAEELVLRLAAVTDDDDPEKAVHTVTDGERLAHVALHAATAPGRATAPEPIDGRALPPRAAVAGALQAFVARDLACNLPALAAQQYLDDLPAGGADGGAPLVRLLARMLERRDLASASWLLAEVDHRADVPAAARARMREQAERVADDAWLAALLQRGSRDELMQLAAFVMQLGERVAERFAALVAAAAHPFSRWLGELLR
jgi:hypothetical protein